MRTWYEDAVFYHIYPLGFCGAPEANDYQSAAVERLLKVEEWIPHLRDMGYTALYIGPVFESETHGYDTVDYRHVDRRLGTNDTLKKLVGRLHENGIRVVLDGVFNHVSRQHEVFKKLQQEGRNSQYASWFKGVDFDGAGEHGDGFSYAGWNGHSSLPQLDVTQEAVREYHFSTVQGWIEEFDIDGIRLDVADSLDMDFLHRLAGFVKTQKDEFWLMGEVIHGDYSQWARPDRLHSTTNYECYKGLYSSHNDHNYFEIAHSMERLFGANGTCRELLLYNFADNHDVNRVASELNDGRHLYPLHVLLFTMPGIPSTYYGSEYGVPGRRDAQSDQVLRPCLQLEELAASPHAGLQPVIKKLIEIRKRLVSLRGGGYAAVHIASEQLVFVRSRGDEQTLVAVNMADKPVEVELQSPLVRGGFVDELNGQEKISDHGGQLTLNLAPCWGRVLRRVV